MERPPAPPEAVLIRLAREAADLRMAEAAKNAGVSVARWSQIETGSEMRSGRVTPVRARAGTIARMAREVGITPERMESDGQRPDAAEILREMERHDPAPAAAPSVLTAPVTAPADDLADVRVLLEGVERAKMPVRPEFDRVMKIVREFPPGVVIPGVVLYDDPRYQRAWDDLAGREYSPGRVYTPARMALVIAVQQYRDQRRAAERDSDQGGMAAGLSRAP